MVEIVPESSFINFLGFVRNLHQTMESANNFIFTAVVDGEVKREAVTILCHCFRVLDERRKAFESCRGGQNGRNGCYS